MNFSFFVYINRIGGAFNAREGYYPGFAVILYFDNALER